MTNITPIRITARALLPRVRDAAKLTSNIVFLPPLEMRSMAGAMTFRQVLNCLRSGQIVGKPILDEHGAWQFTMERNSAGYSLPVQVVAECSGVAITRLIVLWENQ